jgi:hypothetical protein
MDTKIIVIQKDLPDLRGIKSAVRKISRDRLEEIVFTQSIEDVMLWSHFQEAIIVFSGQVFDKSLLGIELAHMVKDANPKALFFLYSTWPIASADIDGVIPKDTNESLDHRDHTLLATILTSNLDEPGTLAKLRTEYRPPQKMFIEEILKTKPPS